MFSIALKLFMFYREIMIHVVKNIDFRLLKIFSFNFRFRNISSESESFKYEKDAV